MSGVFRAKIRMYRHRLGDCWLITLPLTDGNGEYFIMIDCGVILGTKDAAEKMTHVVDDIAAATKRIDLLVATHEHWDHLSGFVQAAETLKQIHFETVWLAWTEDPNDAQAAALSRDRSAALSALRLSAARMRLASASEAADELDGIVSSFFGAAGNSTASAMDAVKHLSKKIRYCDPADPPEALPGTSVRSYILGPPRDETLLKKLLLAPSNRDAYGIDAGSNFFMANVAPILGSSDPDGPFDSMQAIPLDVARQMPFFQRYYWPIGAAPVDAAPAWRNIDTAWLADSTDLALQLDSITNNTSLVLVLELGGGETLLFPGDAQVGNWLSWQNVSWTVDGKRVTGPDLLERCIFYKVGHHGSHNATLKEHGLETMHALATAMIPVDHDEAVKKRWNRMPLPALVDRLGQVTHGNVVRADEALPNGSTASAGNDGFSYEITL